MAGIAFPLRDMQRSSHPHLAAVEMCWLDHRLAAGVAGSGREDLAVEIEQPRHVVGRHASHPALRADAPLAPPG